MTAVFPSRGRGERGRSTAGLGRVLAAAALALVSCDQNFSDTPLPDATAEERARLAARLSQAPELSVPAGTTIAGFIELAPGLERLTAPEDVLFLMARAPGAGGPPVAVERLTGNAYPMPFVLEAPLGAARRPLQLVVKVDKDGDAGTTVGADLLGFRPEPVSVGDAGVRVTVEATFAELAAAVGDTSSAAPAESGAAGGVAVEGSLELPPELRDRTTPGDVVFVVARDPARQAPPVAVARLTGNRYPMPFRLDDSSRMLSGPWPERLTIEARRDADGDPLTRGPGDLTGSAAESVPVPARDVRIRLGDRR